MLNLLVTIDHSLEASFALRTACLFGVEVAIQPIHVFDPPGRDISFGAGWARKSWERETSRLAEETVEGLVVAERNQCANIDDPVVLTGEPILEMTKYFWAGKFDLLVVGAPFRGMGSLALCRRFGNAAHKERRNLPLLVVQKLKPIETIVALTDGSHPAENALGLMLKLNTFNTKKIFLVGMADPKSKDISIEALNVERGMAILNEQGIEATPHRASELGVERLSDMVKDADLLINPIHRNDPRSIVYDVQESQIPSVLLYVNGS